VVTVLCETCHQICPFSVAGVRPSLQELSIHLSHILFTNGYHHWRFFVSVPGWTQDDSYRNNVVVGLNGGFLHTAQLGANCLNGTGRGDLGKASTTTRKPHGGNRRAQEGATRGKRLVSL
jgi:hypothetical protein